MTNAGQRIIAIANPELGRLQDCEMIVFKMPSSVEGVGINEFGMDTSSEWIPGRVDRRKFPANFLIHIR